MASETERRLILEMIENGKISAEEGLRLIQALDEDEADELQASDEPAELQTSFQAHFAHAAEPPLSASPAEPASEVGDAQLEGDSGPERFDLPGESENWRRWWLIPLWAGVGITVLAGILMFWAQQATGFGFWFYCSWLPFFFGLAIIVLAWQSRTARWLHLRIQQKEGEWPHNIAISFPLPIRLTAWFFRLFGNKIPGLQGTSVDEMIMALDNTTSPGNPLYVKVEEGEDGERVEVFIG